MMCNLIYESTLFHLLIFVAIALCILGGRLFHIVKMSVKIFNMVVKYLGIEVMGIHNLSHVLFRILVCSFHLSIFVH